MTITVKHVTLNVAGHTERRERTFPILLKRKNKNVSGQINKWNREAAGLPNERKLSSEGGADVD